VTSCDITEEAAETEPAWKGAGAEVGLQIWRIVVSICFAVDLNRCGSQGLF